MDNFPASPSITIRRPPSRSSAPIIQTHQRTNSSKRRGNCPRCKSCCGLRAFRSHDFTRKVLKRWWNFWMCAFRRFVVTARLHSSIACGSPQPVKSFRKAGSRGKLFRRKPPTMKFVLELTLRLFGRQDTGYVLRVGQFALPSENRGISGESSGSARHSWSLHRLRNETGLSQRAYPQTEWPYSACCLG